ncbi:hypothetical protein DL96DRAFT_1603627 [Flagelloscypha sp. PMI_526]|nr:hypothetical protein DL96DRAFT_1603627 [Flagelloscypha sp. PMI_526]
MRLGYPASTSRPNSQPDNIQVLRIARHSRCTVCSCHGLHPASDIEIVLDDDEDYLDAASDVSDDHNQPPPYLQDCACGHSLYAHGADIANLGREEFLRRSRAASRIDELLHDALRLRDFNYITPDIKSLRKQMVLPHRGVSPSTSRASSVLSDPEDQPPPTKRRRISRTISTSPLSGNSDDDDTPLASRVPAQRGGKKQPGHHKTKAGTAPTSIPPPTGHTLDLMNGVTTNGVSKPPTSKRQRVQDRLDSGQIVQLTSGVTVDTTASTPGHKPEKIAIQELRKGLIHVTAVENDNQPRSLILLTGLKVLFQKQLPKMPREYIARLVYDTNSRGLAVIKLGYKVVGGILFRPFPHRGFAEIVFFATASVDQVKGYGGMLMDHFKMHIKHTYPNMNHFLTYADNYAVGYFEKQGFSKEITLERSIWAGYIKDYEGGTIMQCTMLDKVDYLNKSITIAIQQEAVMEKIRQCSKSHVVHSGLPQFRNGPVEGLVLDYKEVPGLKEAGWNPSMIVTAKPRGSRTGDQIVMERLLRDLKEHSLAWAFQQPVSREEVPDYYDHIKDPMDFSTMTKKLENNQYTDLELFADDARLVFDNCVLYNPSESIYAKNAIKMKNWFEDKFGRIGR